MTQCPSLLMYTDIQSLTRVLQQSALQHDDQLHTKVTVTKALETDKRKHQSHYYTAYSDSSVTNHTHTHTYMSGKRLTEY